MQLAVPSLGRILKLYAFLIGSGGVLLLVLTPATDYLANTPYIAVTILHLLGAMLLVSATFAAWLASTPETRGLGYFLAGQWVALGLVMAKYHAIFQYQLPVWPVALHFAGVLVITFHRLSYPPPSRGPSTYSLRHRYEQEIRRAAGQEERHRLARDLHDSIKQHVFALQTAAATAEQAERAEVFTTALSQVRESARDVMTELDAMLDQLKAEPLTGAGLVDALQKLCETARLRTGAQVQFTTSALPPDRHLPPGAPNALLRIAQEALSNSARHARAGSIAVRLDTQAGNLQLSIQDDGAGFDAAAPAGGMGLRNIRSRAEELGGAAVVTSAPGTGTQVRVTLPLASPRANRRSIWIASAMVIAFLFLTANPNPLHPLLMRSLQAALALFIVLHLLRRPERSR